MQTDKRLDQAYGAAPVLSIDNNSRIIVMSDMHRGDNSAADEFAHNQSVFYHALCQYLAGGFTYIEAGDGDELWEHKRFHHIREAHSDVYRLLSDFHADKRLYLLYGNHNMIWRTPATVKRHLFRYYDTYTDTEADLWPASRYTRPCAFTIANPTQSCLCCTGTRETS